MSAQDLWIQVRNGNQRCLVILPESDGTVLYHGQIYKVYRDGHVFYIDINQSENCANAETTS